MRVCLLLDPSRVYRWHGWLVESLAALPGCEVSWRFAAETRPLPRACEWLCHLERLVYRLRTSAIDRLDTLAGARAAQGSPAEDGSDVVVDLAGAGRPAGSAARLVTPLFNGVAGEIGILAAYVRKEPPSIEIHDSADPGAALRAQPAPADGDLLSRVLDAALSCAAPLIAKALSRPGPATAAAPRPYPAAAAAPSTAATARRLADTTSRKLTRLLDRLARGGERWAVAWRMDHAQTLLDRRSARFAVLPDDGRRYYADPFPFRWNGRNFIFVEEFPYATGRGCISLTEIGDDGRATVPRVVLEEPHHLSYPFVFEHDGSIWMIPEAGESGRVSLYRAVAFPDRWVHEAVLVDGVAAYDATLFRHRNRFWLFLCEQVWQSSSWDILSLFHADALAGDWVPHALNPVMCDAVSSRPAGAMFAYNGRIVRPTQDCSARYGGSVKLCALDALDQGTFDQSVIGRIDCGSDGCHTYNYAAGLEVIDVFGPVRRGGGVDATFSAAS